MKQVQSKMITVDSRGYVMTSRGRVMTPIRTPYRESVDRIWSMITQDRADVKEHIGGKKIPLTVLNFDTDNSVEEQKEAAPTEPEVKPEGSAKVVSDIKTPSGEVYMRTGDVFSVDPSKAQNHHNPVPENEESPVGEQKPEETSNINEGQKEAAPTEPEVKPEGNAGETSNDNSSPQRNDQQGSNKNQNNGKNGKNHKHNKYKGNNNQDQSSQKVEEKKDGTSEAPVTEEKPAEPTTGSDLAVTPESV